MSREYAPRERLHRNDRGQSPRKEFFGGRTYIPPEAQWATYTRNQKERGHVEPLRVEKAESASLPVNTIQRKPKEDLSGKSLQEHVGRGEKFVKTKSGQVLDTNHMLDFRNQTLAAIGHITAHAPSVSKSNPTFVVPFKTEMHREPIKAEIGIDFEINGHVRRLTKDSGPSSVEVQRLARDLMSTASYFVEYIQAGMPLGWGSAYQEEDLKSNYMGIEIGARAAKIMASNPRLSEKDAATIAKDQVFADAGVESTMKSYGTKEKDMDFRFKGGEKVYGEYTPGTGGISLRNYYVYVFQIGKKISGRKISRAAMAHVRSLFFKMYRESLSKRKK